MTSIVKGDRIKVAPSVSVRGGKVGEVTQIAPCPFSGGEPLITLRFDDGEELAYDRKELLLLGEAEEEPKVGGEISFEQIRKGDRIRTVREFEDGFVLTMEGVADHLRFDGSWVAKDGQHSVAPEGKGAALKQHHILVDRPEPKDHLVVFSRTTGAVEAYTVVGRTKTEAEKIAAERNAAEAGKIERRIFRAVKVSEHG